MRALELVAAKGQVRATKLLVQLATETATADRQLKEQYFEAARAYKASWERELYYRECSCISGPPPMPHPDDIIIDPRAGTVTFKGPIANEEAKEYQDCWEHIREIAAVIETCHAKLDSKMQPNKQEFWLQFLSDLQERRQLFVRGVGEPPRVCRNRS
jgi:hypothetical protein